MKLWRVEHFWTYLSSLLGVIAIVFSNHAQKWRQICCESVQPARVSFFLFTDIYKPSTMISRYWAMSKPAKSKERKRLLQIVVNRGDYENNLRTHNNNRGKFNVLKRTDNPTDVRDYIHCLYCHCVVKQRLWWKHAQKYPGMTKKKLPCSQKQHNIQSRKRVLFEGGSYLRKYGNCFTSLWTFL